MTAEREKLAELEHQQWAHWTRHMLEVLNPLLQMAAFSPLRLAGSDKAREALERWKRQINTPYADLSEKEKDSDREWADKVLAAMERKEAHPNAPDYDFVYWAPGDPRDTFPDHYEHLLIINTATGEVGTGELLTKDGLWTVTLNAASGLWEYFVILSNEPWPKQLRWAVYSPKFKER